MPRALDPPLSRFAPASHLRTWVALERSHRWSPRRMAAWQVARLQAVVAHAHRRVALYGSRGPAPRFDTLAAFRDAVPLLEAAELRSRDLEDRLAAPIPPGSQRFTTSGSTGRTATVIYPPVQRRLLGAMSMRMSLRRGILPHWRVAALSAGSTGAGAVRTQRRTTIPATVEPQRVAELLDEIRPHVVTGYPHLLLDAAPLRARPERLRAVTTFGEQLDGATRRGLRDQFGVDPTDTYGANEFGALAWQCRRADLYHLNHELVHVEVVDDDGRAVAPGGEGRVVVTDLANGLLPHLRYVLGDIARFATRPCACGHVLPAIEHVAGRQLDWLVGADGSRIAPERLWMDLVVPIHELEPIERYRVHQREDGSVRVSVVPHGTIDDEALARIRAGYAAALGEGIPVTIEVVEEIPRTAAGKFPMVTSDRKPPDAPA